MRVCRLEAAIRLHAVDGFQVVEGSQQAFDIFGISGVDDVQVERIDWRPVQYGRNSAYYDEFNLVLVQGADDLKKVAGRHGIG